VHTKKRWPKGVWMTLKSADVLIAFMHEKDFSGARLARYAGCSRQFISQLLTGKRSTCTPKLAVNISEALGVPLEILFAPSGSSDAGRIVKSTARRRAAA
jgi:transcriptional regulator with XRE-family HTH domain